MTALRLFNTETQQWEPILAGERGSDGTSATIAVGSVTTGNPGDPVTVVNSGTSSEAVFDFSIPRGADGGMPLKATITSTDGIRVRKLGDPNIDPNTFDYDQYFGLWSTNAENVLSINDPDSLLVDELSLNNGIRLTNQGYYTIHLEATGGISFSAIAVATCSVYLSVSNPFPITNTSSFQTYSKYWNYGSLVSASTSFRLTSADLASDTYLNCDIGPYVESGPTEFPNQYFYFDLLTYSLAVYCWPE